MAPFFPPPCYGELPPDPDPEGLSLLAAPIGAITAYSDGGGSLRVGNSFYTSRVDGIRVLGARLWIPEGATGGWLTETITFHAYRRDWAGSSFPAGLPTDLVTSKASAGPRVAGSWIEVAFDTPFTIAAINSAAAGSDIAAIAYQSASGNLYGYLPGTHFSSPVESQHGDDVFFAEGGVTNGFNNLGEAPTIWYGIDLLYELLP